MIDYQSVKVTRIFFCQTPAGKVFIPRQIPAGHQEVELIVSGYGEFTVEGIRHRLGPGMAIWFGGGELIHATADRVDPYATVALVFAATAPAGQPPTMVFEWESPSSCARFGRNALEQFNLQHLGEEDSFGVCLYARMVWEAECSRRRRALRQMPPAVDACLRYIDAHYREPIMLADVAAAAGISVSHLHELFRESVMTPPFQYILKLRMEEACRLLSETSLSVKEVCDRCGFSDLRNFCAQFKRRQQLTPGGYRILTRGG